MQELEHQDITAALQKDVGGFYDVGAAFWQSTDILGFAGNPQIFSRLEEADPDVEGNRAKAKAMASQITERLQEEKYMQDQVVNGLLGTSSGKNTLMDVKEE